MKTGSTQRPPADDQRWRTVVDLAPGLCDGPIASGGSLPRLPARVMHVSPGAVDHAGIAGGEDWIGLLVLDGLLLVELEAGRAHAGWLVGAEDLVRPWDAEDISLVKASRWRALTPARIALLDGQFSMRVGAAPTVARALVARAARTTNWLLAKSLVLSSPGVEERLLLAFALFGERWGTVRHDGIHVKLPLTHALLAALCGVRRPSVTVALGALEHAGMLSRTADGGWLLNRHPPNRNGALPSCWPQYAAALGLGDPAAPQPLPPMPCSEHDRGRGPAPGSG